MIGAGCRQGRGSGRQSRQGLYERQRHKRKPHHTQDSGSNEGSHRLKGAAVRPIRNKGRRKDTHRQTH